MRAGLLDLVDPVAGHPVTDRAAMLPLPPIPPQLGWSNTIRLGTDYYVRSPQARCSSSASAASRQGESSSALADKIRQ